AVIVDIADNRRAGAANARLLGDVNEPPAAIVLVDLAVADEIGPAVAVEIGKRRGPAADGPVLLGGITKPRRFRFLCRHDTRPDPEEANTDENQPVPWHG